MAMKRRDPELRRITVPVPANTPGRVRDLLADGHRRGVLAYATKQDRNRARTLASRVDDDVVVPAVAGRAGIWRWWSNVTDEAVRLIVEVAPVATIDASGTKAASA